MPSVGVILGTGLETVVIRPMFLRTINIRIIKGRGTAHGPLHKKQNTNLTVDVT